MNFKYPAMGDVIQVNNLQLGGVAFCVKANGDGKNQLTNVKHFLVSEGPVQVSCEAGSLAIFSGKHQTGMGRVWCLALGPPAVSCVDDKPAEDQAEKGKHKRPRGRAPRDKEWDEFSGTWQPKRKRKRDSSSDEDD